MARLRSFMYNWLVVTIGAMKVTVRAENPILAIQVVLTDYTMIKVESIEYVVRLD